jgi:hypothetical protein
VRTPRPPRWSRRGRGMCSPHMRVAGAVPAAALTASLPGRGTSRQRWGHTNRPHRSLNREGTPMASSGAARPFTVNRALTLNRPALKPPTGRRARRREGVENPEFAAFGRRVIRAHGRRVAAGDLEGLAELLALGAEVEQATQAARPSPGSRQTCAGACASSRGPAHAGTTTTPPGPAPRAGRCRRPGPEIALLGGQALGRRRVRASSTGAARDAAPARTDVLSP